MRSGSGPRPTLPDQWGPSALNTLSTCGLRTAYDLDETYRSNFKRDNTYSVMGTASHELTRLVWTGLFNSIPEDSLANALTNEWTRLIDHGRQVLVEQWFGAEVPRSVDWPYYSVRSRATIRRLKDEIINNRVHARGNKQGSVRVEKWIVDSKLKLRGIPDRVIITDEGFFVLDLKTGQVGDSISPPIRRQLLIYAHLVSLTTDKPLLGVGVVNASGDVIWDDASQDDVDLMVSEVHQLIKRFESEVERGHLDGLANPEPTTCRYCPYRAVCVAYWNDENHDWMEFRGAVGNVVTVIDDKTFTLRQTRPVDQEGEIIGISNCTHGSQVGDLVAVVDGSRRGNSIRGYWYTRTTVLTSSQPS